jgi:hypothetical protein
MGQGQSRLPTEPNRINWGALNRKFDSAAAKVVCEQAKFVLQTNMNMLLDAAQTIREFIIFSGDPHLQYTPHRVRIPDINFIGNPKWLIALDRPIITQKITTNIDIQCIRNWPQEERSIYPAGSAGEIRFMHDDGLRQDIALIYMRGEPARNHREVILGRDQPEPPPQEGGRRKTRRSSHKKKATRRRR